MSTTYWHSGILIFLGMAFFAQRPAEAQGWARELSADAVYLTLAIQTGIPLDAGLAENVEDALAAARTVNDSLRSLQLHPPYERKTLLVHPLPAFADAWRAGRITTGYRPIDSLGERYGLETAEPIPLGWCKLGFDRDHEMHALAEQYRRIVGDQSAEPDGTFGDGDHISLLRKNAAWHFVFSHGWGDCPSGCIHRNSWYVVVDSLGQPRLEEFLPDEQRLPRIYRWNIPERYPATVFASADDILLKTQAADWWVRRHAVEVLEDLFTQAAPRYGEDAPSAYARLRDAVLLRKTDVVRALHERLNDRDADVRQSAVDASAAIMAPSSSMSRYFPLRVGNSWTFRVSNSLGDGIEGRRRAPPFAQHHEQWNLGQERREGGTAHPRDDGNAELNMDGDRIGLAGGEQRRVVVQDQRPDMLGPSFTEAIISERKDGQGNVWFMFDYLRSMERPELSFTQDNMLRFLKNSREQNWVDFDPVPGSSWKVPVPDTDSTNYWMVQLESTTDTVTVPAGTFTDVYRFRFTFNGADNDWIEWYAPNVGPVKRTLFGFGTINYVLESWNVDTVTTGVKVPPAIPSAIAIRSVYPNPATSAATVDIIVHRPSRFDIVITDLLGRQRAAPIEAVSVGGVYSFPLALDRLPAGMYCIWVRTDAMTDHRWFTITR